MITLKKSKHKQSSEEWEQFLRQLKSDDLSGTVLLQTCNRVELYGGNGQVPEDIVRHLFRLVSGLESHFIGESFIVGQIKEAYQTACTKWNLDASLHRLFQWAMLTGKRVRSETAISRGAMSHSHAVVEIIKNSIENYKAMRFAFIGVNKINKTIMTFLKDNVNSSFLLCNRTYDKAVALEQQFNCQAFRLDHLKESLLLSDIIISATSAPHAIIHAEHIPLHRSQVIFDLAVPSDVDPTVVQLPNIQYYSIVSIENKVIQNIADRSAEIVKAVSIVEEEIDKFLVYQNKYWSRKLDMNTSPSFSRSSHMLVEVPQVLFS